MRIAPVALVGLILTACVTINVYFPAVAAERAADRIIEDVWGDGARPKEQSPPTPPEPSGQPTSRLETPGPLDTALGQALELVISPAHAQADIDISSPAIQKIKASMKARHNALKPALDAGAIGLTNDGRVEVRDPKAVPLQERNDLKKLVTEENADRNALYREIANANQHPEWEDDIRKTFAKSWVDKASGGWWYQDKNGEWKQK
jgi:uncharacterized protein YdbL (DUF1318 family)